MDLTEARKLCPDIAAVERGGTTTCVHVRAPWCNHPAHFFCVFYQPLTSGVARRIDEPAAAPAAAPLSGEGNAAEVSPEAVAGSSHPAGFPLHDHVYLPDAPPGSPYGPRPGCPACPPAESPAVLLPEVPALEPPSDAAPDGERPRLPRLSVSAVQTFSTCRRKYKLSYIDRWRPRIDPQALVISRLFDRGLQPIIQTGNWNPDDLAMTPEDLEIIGNDGWSKLVASLDGFRDHAELKPNYGVCQYRIEFRWCGEHAIGFLDYWDQNKTVWEFKFTTEVEVCPARYKLQMAIYARATGAQRIVYYPIRKPELQHKKSESSDQYTQRIRDDIGRRPGHYFIPREYQPSELSVYLDDITPQHIRAALENGKLDDFPRNWTACDMYTGCEFLPICSADGLVDDKLYFKKS